MALFTTPERSIPAHAGEPLPDGQARTLCRVYPRPRGGTGEERRVVGGSAGLSPPTRGNRLGEDARMRRPGSIPAHAGEPHSQRAVAGRRSVYPRPRGGTAATDAAGDEVDGLSPPTRGNRALPPRRARLRRSIPAHAGEPPDRQPRYCGERVYPRPRGGTSTRRKPLFGSSGLSPPTRGNRVEPVRLRGLDGSIPAHAGEPAAPCPPAAGCRVYPRPRGGTE